MPVKRSLIAISLIMIALSFWSISYAINSEEFNVQQVSFQEGSATLYAHESVWLGVTCKSGPIGKVEDRTSLSIGDTVTVGKFTVNVGFIECTKYYEEIKFHDEIIANKGETICVAAKNKDMLPHDDECHAVWIRIRDCQP